MTTLSQPYIGLMLTVPTKLLRAGNQPAIRAFLKARACAAIDEATADIDSLIERAEGGQFA